MLTIAYMLFAKVSSAELWPHHTYFPTVCCLDHRKAYLEKKINNVMSMKFIMFSGTSFRYSFGRHDYNSILIFDSISLNIIRNKLSKCKWCMLSKHQLHIHYWADRATTLFPFRNQIFIMERTGSKISHENLLVFIILERSCMSQYKMSTWFSIW